MTAQMTREELEVPAGFDDAWTWVAVYTDGTHAAEYDAGGVEGRWADVALHKVARVVLMPVPSPDWSRAWPQRVPQQVVVPRGGRAVFTRRRSHLVFGDTALPPVTTTIIGWEDGGLGCYLHLTDSGYGAVSDDYNLDFEAR